MLSPGSGSAGAESLFFSPGVEASFLPLGVSGMTPADGLASRPLAGAGGALAFQLPQSLSGARRDWDTIQKVLQGPPKTTKFSGGELKEPRSTASTPNAPADAPQSAAHRARARRRVPPGPIHVPTKLEAETTGGVHVLDTHLYFRGRNNIYILKIFFWFRFSS